MGAAAPWWSLGAAALGWGSAGAGPSCRKLLRAIRTVTPVEVATRRVAGAGATRDRLGVVITRAAPLRHGLGLVGGGLSRESTLRLIFLRHLGRVARLGECGLNHAPHAVSCQDSTGVLG